MNIFKLFRFFFLNLLCLRIVDGEGGGAAGEEEGETGQDDDSAGAAGNADPGEREEGEGDPEDGADDAADGEGEADEGLVVSLGDDDAANDDDAQEEMTPKARKAWAEMRIKLSAQKKANRELEQRLAASTPAPAPVTVGPEPTMEDDDVDFDADKFKTKYKTWHEAKTKADQIDQANRQTQQQQQQQWETRLTAVDKAAAAFKWPDADEANQVFEDTFSVMQRGLILDTPDDPKTSAMLRQALGTNPATAKKLAAIQHPGKFIFAIKDTIDKMKTTPRKTAPPPERVVRSSAAGAAAVDNQVERLRDEARRTGDYSKVSAYQRQQADKTRRRA